MTSTAIAVGILLAGFGAGIGFNLWLRARSRDLGLLLIDCGYIYSARRRRLMLILMGIGGGVLAAVLGMIVMGWGGWPQALVAASMWMTLSANLPRGRGRTQIREQGILYGGEAFRWKGIQGYRWESATGAERIAIVDLTGWSAGKSLRLTVPADDYAEADNVLRRCLPPAESASATV